jgi:hypothetical protein
MQTNRMIAGFMAAIFLLAGGRLEAAVTCADTTHGADAYQYYAGTSMSAAYASGAAANRIDLDWTASEPVDTGIEIQRRPNSGSEYETIAIVGADETAYSDGGLADGATYVYRLLTLSRGERTGYSNETAATALSTVSSTVDISSGGGGGGCFIAADFGGWDIGRLAWIRPIAVAVAILILVVIVAISLRRRIERPVIVGPAGRRNREPQFNSSGGRFNG